MLNCALPPIPVVAGSAPGPNLLFATPQILWLVKAMVVMFLRCHLNIEYGPSQTVTPKGPNDKIVCSSGEAVGMPGGIGLSVAS